MEEDKIEGKIKEEKKIYPTVEELSKINNFIPCPKKKCKSVFTSKSNLTLHLAKTHKKAHLMKSVDYIRLYYCPRKSCIYHSKKSFKNLKYLKQHFLKVHGKKDFVCDICEKGFPSLTLKNAHWEYCGIEFKCIDCKASYPCYESLITHGRRKKHNIFEKASYKTGGMAGKSISAAAVYANVGKPRYILPKGTASCHTMTECNEASDDMITESNDDGHNEEEDDDDDEYVDDPPEYMQDKSNQTDFNEGEAEGGEIIVNDNSSQTELFEFQPPMQTFYDCDSRVANPNSVISKKSMETQTRVVTSNTKSCNTSFSFDEMEYPYGTVEMNTCSTQTVFPVPTDFSYTRPTETPKDITFDMEGLDTDNFFNCNMETQTDFIFEDDDLICPDYYSNMYTQTCDNILLDDLGFNTTQTQTVFDEMLKSVESQTSMSPSPKIVLSCRDMAHMETQTDAEFRQILEEINT